MGKRLLIIALSAGLFGAANAEDYRSLPSISDPLPKTEIGVPTVRNEVGPQDLELIVKTYNANEMRFVRDYKGRAFYGVLPFKDAKQSIISAGTYRVGLGHGTFMSSVDCNFSDPADVSKMSDWNPNDDIQVVGRIKDVTFGSVELEPCTMARQQN